MVDNILQKMQQQSRDQMEVLNTPIAQSLKRVKHKIAVFSGKGGVGKTTATVNLAVALAGQGYKVAILDADVHGPAVPKILGGAGKLEISHGRPEVQTNLGGHDHREQTNHDHESYDQSQHEHDKEHGHLGHTHGGHDHSLRFEPIETKSGVKMVSVDSIWPDWENPVMWRGPFKSRIIRQFLGAINWGELDYLLVDLPPGTGDEVLTIMNSIPGLDGMVVVSTPQDVSTSVCQKAINTAKEMNVPILGVIENMSVFCCPNCQTDIRIFGQRTAERLARMMEVDFLGSIPFMVEVNESSDAGIPVVIKYPDSSVALEVARIAGLLITKVGVARGRQE